MIFAVTYPRIHVLSFDTIENNFSDLIDYIYILF